MPQKGRGGSMGNFHHQRLAGCWVKAGGERPLAAGVGTYHHWMEVIYLESNNKRREEIKWIVAILVIV